MRYPICPACRTTTELVRWQDITGFACNKCQGHFIRPDALREFLLKQARLARFNRLMELARDAPPALRPLLCPDCNSPTFHTLRAGLVEIDACTTCIGVYFDQHEATRYLSLMRARTTAGNVMTGATSGIDAIDAIGALIEFITTFLH